MTAAPSTAAELDPQAGGLIEDARARAPERLGGRDSRAALVGALAFLAVAVPFAFLAPSGRAASPGVFVLFVVAYAVAARVEFEVGPGFAVPTELVFVPMLFLLPIGSSRCCVALGFVLCASVDVVRGKVHGERALLEVFSAWHALGPAVVLALAGEPDPTWAVLPMLGLALAAQFGLDFASSAARARYAFGVPAREQLRATAPVYLVDAALAPAGFLFAVVAFDQPYALLLVLPLVGLLAFFARERTRAHRPRARARPRLPRDGAPARRRDRGRRRVHGRAQPRRRRARRRRRRRARARRETAARRRAGRAPPRRRQDPHPEPRSSTSRARSTPEERGDHRDAHGRGRADARPGRRPPRPRSATSSARATSAGTAAATRTASPARRSRSSRASSAPCDAYNAMTTDRPYRAALLAGGGAGGARSSAPGTQFDPEVVAALAAVVARGR